MVPPEVMDELRRGAGEDALRSRFPEHADRVGQWVRQFDLVGRGIRSGQGRLGGVEVRGYRLISEVARGGQGVVYRAVREGEGEARFAVKVLRPASSPEDAMSHHARLEREARVLRTVEHERIVRPHEVGATPDGRAYLVMDFVEGTALTPETVKGLEVAHRVALVGAVARTVGAAHARGVVHRDLKPSNILVARDGIPVVLDFGMASVVDAEEMRQTLTTTGQFVGTYLWASPEQLRGERELSAASDVYSLGVLMHQLVTGRFPPQVFSSLRRLIEPGVEDGGVGEGSDSVAGVGDARLAAVVRRCLSPEPAGRFHDGVELAEAIEAYLRGEGPVEKTTRHRKGIWAAAAGLVALAAGLAALWWSVGERPVPEPVLLHAGMSPTGRRLVTLKTDPTQTLAFIPPGSFVIGSPNPQPARVRDELQQTATFEHGFYMLRNEVTQQLYQRVMGTNPSRFTVQPSHPAERVSWYDAVEFCLRLSELEGRTIRLPTEIEWEYACRAGTTTLWHFGDDPRMMIRYANFADETSSSINSVIAREPFNDGWAGTSPVGMYLSNAWDMRDMHGNVWEWTSSEYFVDPMNPETPSPATTPTVSRVSKGGSWHDTRWTLRSAGRNPLKPEAKTSTLGFRIAMDESEAEKK